MKARPFALRLVKAGLVSVIAGPLLLALPATSAYAGDGVGSDSASVSCSSGYYYCWSNVQQRSVCTTRKCY